MATKKFFLILVLAAIFPIAAMATNTPPQDPDVNQDGTVNIFDLVILGYNFDEIASDAVVPQTTAAGGPITTRRLDLNWSGKVDLADMQIAADQFGMTKPQVAALMASLRPDVSLAVTPKAKLATTWGNIKGAAR